MQIQAITLAATTTNLDVDTIELIKACPVTTSCQALEELAHSNIIQPIRTVKHHTLHCQRFGQILGGLRLASAYIA